MDILIADIGGTNTRLALAEGSCLRKDTLAYYTNANWNNFDEMLESYLRERSAPRIKNCCIAIAGAVENGRTCPRFRLNWNIDMARVEHISGAQRAELINDMRALGFALPDVALAPICGANKSLKNGQSLVVNIGTGFNITAVHAHSNQLISSESELGCTALPTSARDLLRAEIGDAVDSFRAIGDCFGGAGAAVIARAVARTDMNDDEAVRSLCAQDGPAAERAGRIFAKALGLLTSDLTRAYLPRNGVIFAGSVARGVLGSPAATTFIEEFHRDRTGHPMAVVDSHDFPVFLIEDDAAALLGCLRRAQEM